MPNKLREIIKEIIEDYGLDCKKVLSRNLEAAGTKLDYGTPHIIYYYNMKSIGKCIYMEYDVYRGVAREVSVFDPYQHRI